MGNVVSSVDLRIGVKDDTAAGAKSARRTIQQLAADSEKQLAGIGSTNDPAAKQAAYDKIYRNIVAQKELEAKASSAAKGRSGGHGSRVYTDASTTGLDPLQRAGAGFLGTKLGNDLGVLKTAVWGKAIADGTEKLKEFTTLMREGKTDAAGMAIAIGESIPVLGSYVTAGQNIREIFTGERHELQLQEQYIQQIETAQEAVYRGSIKLQETRRQERDTLKQIRMELAGIGLRGQPGVEHGITAEKQAAQAAADAAIAKAKNEARDDPNAKAASKAVEEFDTTGKGVRLRKAQEELETMPTAGSRRLRDDRKHKEAEVAGLQAERDRLVNAKKNAESNATEKMKGTIDTEEQKAGLAGGKAYKQIQEARKLDMEARKQAEAEGAAAVMRMQGETEPAILRRVGNIKEAELRGIDVRTQAEIRGEEIRAEAEKQATKDTGKRTEIEGRLIQTRAQITYRAEEERAAVEKEFSLRSIKAKFDAGEAERGAAVSIRDEKLRIEGQGAEASLVMLKENAAKRKREIDVNLAAELASDQTNADEKRRIAAAAKAQIDAETAQQTRRQIEQNRREGVSNESAVTGFEVGNLRFRAGHGDRAAAQKAFELETKDKYAKQRSDIQALLASETASKEQKDRARQALGGIDARESEELKYGQIGPRRFTNPGATTGGYITGLAARTREENDPMRNLIKTLEDQRKIAERALKAQEETAKNTAHKPKAPPKPIFNDAA